MKRFMFTALSILLILYSGCTPEKEVTIGTVKVFSNGIEFTPVSNWVSSYYDGLAGCGAFLMPYDVRDQLTAIPYGDNFRVEIVGNNIDGVIYTLYRSDFFLNDEAEYYNLDTLKIPDEQGEYIASVQIVWHNGMHDKKYKSEGYQYLFMISV